MSTSQTKSKELFRSPFSRDYWRCATREFTNYKALVFAAVIVAMRIMIKSVKIIIAPGLSFGFDFLINSAGSMIYGPVVALLVGAISDTIGAILFPVGPYFFPFIVVEMLSGFIFALYLYRAKLSPIRIILSRLTVIIICNLLINPAIMTWNNYLFYGSGYEFITLARVIKNVALFPAESIVLVFWLGAISAATYRLKFTFSEPEKLRIRLVHILVLIGSVVIAAAAIWGYIVYKENASNPVAGLDEVKAFNEESNLPYALGTLDKRMRKLMFVDGVDDGYHERASVTGTKGVIYELYPYKPKAGSAEGTRYALKVSLSKSVFDSEKDEDVRTELSRASAHILGITAGMEVVKADARLRELGYVQVYAGSVELAYSKGVIKVSIMADKSNMVESITAWIPSKFAAIDKVNKNLELPFGLGDAYAVYREFGVKELAGAGSDFVSEDNGYSAVLGCFPDASDEKLVVGISIVKPGYSAYGVSVGMPVDEARKLLAASEDVKQSNIDENTYTVDGMVTIILSQENGEIDSIKIYLPEPTDFANSEAGE